MTPRLRLTLRWLRPLVVLTAAALPAYGTAIAYGGTSVHAAEQDSARPSAEQGPPGRDDPARVQATPAPSAPHDAPAAPLPSDSASASVRPYRPLASVEPSRAGSRAGEGRMRPGRPDGPATEVEGDDDPPLATPVAQPDEQQEPEEAETAQIPSASPSPEEAGSAPARPAQQAAQQGEAPTEPVLRLLPLGSGLVLIGLGLGLALLGLRLRRS
ncbi:hypothetical protein ACIP4Y_22670 [Streptomyces sp. NPDC088810]|uniref:hypothetical protein n=1 Tax=Streptomyces sp. NPDC088810 TaxID=3365904 RepID=UPI00381BE2E7